MNIDVIRNLQHCIKELDMIGEKCLIPIIERLEEAIADLTNTKDVDIQKC